MTGTPVHNRPHDLYNLLDTCKMGYGGSFFRWADRYFFLNVTSGGFGRVAVHIHRYLYQSGDVSRKVLGLRPDKFSIAYLQSPLIKRDLAITGDFVPLAVQGKLTLECRSQICNFLATGFAL